MWRCTACKTGFDDHWVNPCPACGKWNTVYAEGGVTVYGKPAPRVEPYALKSRPSTHGECAPALRMRLGTPWDAFFGGGLAAGSVTLLTGAPGVGKSTLAKQWAHAVARTHTVLFVASEETLEQVSERLARLELRHERLRLFRTTDTDELEAELRALGNVALVVVDSLQRLSSSRINGRPGQPAQALELAHMLVDVAKGGGPAVLILGQVVKTGEAAGPKAIEHLVDATLALETGSPTVLRADKNRFAALERLELRMTAHGLELAAPRLVQLR